MSAPHILLAWELGANRGHVTALGGIARAISHRGASVTFAVQRLDALRAVRPLEPGWSVVQAPVWPGLLGTAGYRPPRPPTTYGDILAALGLRDSAMIEFLLRGWDGILAAVRPSMVVTNFAPMAQLACRGRIPVLAAGNGFSLPPDHLAAFPLLEGTAPTFPEEALLKALNLALDRTGRPGLHHLPDLLRADLRMPHCFSVFDPYRTERREPVLAPVLPNWTPGIAAGGDEVFVYFAETVPGARRMFEALPRVGLPVRLYVPNLPAAISAELTQAGIAVEPRPLPIAEIARRSRMVVSHGGLGFVSMCLAAGLPQLILPPDLEKRLIGRAVRDLGAGDVLRWAEASPERILSAVEKVAADDDMRATAAKLGSELSTILLEDSSIQIADAALFSATR